MVRSPGFAAWAAIPCMIVCSATRVCAEFNNPEKVAIIDYNDHAMEPAISRDGKYVFFNNLNEPNVNTNLHWAEAINEVTFKYQGELNGINTMSLEGVASMDRDNGFYFVSTRSYEQTSSTIYRGIFDAGNITNIELVPGVSTITPGMVNFDAEISPDGKFIYFVDSKFGKSGPLTSDIVMAERQGSEFIRLGDSSTILQSVNTEKLEYAPAVSESRLEIYFTRFDGKLPGIYQATRSDINLPFENPKKISSISGFVEAPALSPDELSLYYHRKENDGVFAIYRVTRSFDKQSP